MALAPIQIRRNIKSTWEGLNPILEVGEPIFVIDTGEFKIGTGAAYLDTPVISGGLTTDEVQKEIIDTTIRQRPVSLNAASPTHREYPMLRRPMTGPLFAQSVTGISSIYWPYLVDRWQGNPEVPAAERYAIYFSTDHAPGSGGIAMATAAYPETTTWAQKGRIYYDTTGGDQTETPSVLWDATTNKWLMYYQQRSVGRGGQASVLATSTDGINWTRYGIVLDGDPAFPDVIHSGYMKPGQYAGTRFAYSLSGQGYMRMWTSQDGYKWKPRANILPGRADLMRKIPGFDEPKRWMMKWTSGGVLNWNGRPWFIGSTGEYAPGGELVQDELVAAPLNDTLDDILAAPFTIDPPLQSWQAQSQGIGNALTTDDGRTFAIQRSNGPTGAFSLLEII